MFEFNTMRSVCKRESLLVGKPTITDELRMEDRIDLDAFEITLLNI
jgi:hypothetical protein